MKKFTIALFAAVVFVAMSSCGDKSIKEVSTLTESFFNFSRNNYVDSLELLYPSIDFKYLSLGSDSIRISSVKDNGNDEFEVQVINNFSPDNTLESNVKKAISLTFQKNENGTYPFIISNSVGLIDMYTISEYAYACGAVKDGAKYSDKDLASRLKVTESICYEKIKPVAKTIKENAILKLEYKAQVEDIVWRRFVETCRVKHNNTSALKQVNFFGTSTMYNVYEYSLVKNGLFDFILENNSEYQFCGFTIKGIFYDENDNKVGEATQTFNDVQYAFQDGYYTFRIPTESLSVSKNTFIHIYDLTFDISPDAIWKCTSIPPFTGNEYEEYMSKNHDEEITAATQENGSEKHVVINADKLRFRLGPSTDDEVFTTDGATFYPNKGDRFTYLGESGDFYKIEYNGQELYVSKQYTLLE